MFAASLSFWTGLGACATATLAFVTLWVVVLTRRALTESRKEVQEAHRPVVVPLNDNREIPVVLGAAGHPQERARPFGSNESLYLPVENIGSGPALDVLVRVWALDGPGARLEVEVSGLGVQRPVSVSIKWPELGAGAPTFAFELVYADVAKKMWATTGRYTGEEYERVDVSEASHRSRPRHGPPAGA